LTLFPDHKHAFGVDDVDPLSCILFLKHCSLYGLFLASEGGLILTSAEVLMYKVRGMVLQVAQAEGVKGVSFL